MKRLFAIVLTIALAVSAMVMPVSAADTPVGISNAQGKPGETVSLTLSLKELKNVTSIGIKYTLPEELEFVEATWLLENGKLADAEMVGKAAFSFVEAQDVSCNALKLTMRIKDTTEVNTTCWIPVTVEVKGNDFNEVLCKDTVSGSVSVKPVVLENPFEDVNEDAYYYDAVLWAVNEGVTNGLSATSFGPDGECNRGQVVTFLWRAAGSPEPTSKVSPFTDSADPNTFYYKAVLWAVEEGITNGLSATSFGPDVVCNRGQVVTFLNRYFDSPAASSTRNPFSDVNVTDFFYRAVLWANEKNITNGYGSTTTFCPDVVCNRGQIVTFLYRAVR